MKNIGQKLIGAIFIGGNLLITSLSGQEYDTIRSADYRSSHDEIRSADYRSRETNLENIDSKTQAKRRVPTQKRKKTPNITPYLPPYYSRRKEEIEAEEYLRSHSVEIVDAYLNRIKDLMNTPIPIVPKWRRSKNYRVAVQRYERITGARFDSKRK